MSAVKNEVQKIHDAQSAHQWSTVLFADESVELAVDKD